MTSPQILVNNWSVWLPQSVCVLNFSMLDLVTHLPQDRRTLCSDLFSPHSELWTLTKGILLSAPCWAKQRELLHSLSLSKVCLLVLLYLSWLFPESSPNCKHLPQAAEKTVTQDCSNSQIHARWRGNIIFQLLRSLCLQYKDPISTAAHCHTISTCTELSYFFTTRWLPLQKEG